ncbi:MAG TPA: GH3 auxin-responsive promoter family protein [Planctomycetaceae bacterium]
MTATTPFRSGITALARAAVIPYYRRKLRRFEALLPRAHEVQRATLFDKLHRCADTRFGREHGFAKIQTLADYRRQMPISRYEYFAPYIQAVSRGDVGAMFPPQERVLMFGLSTGTTGESKLNPITPTWLREFRQSLEIWGVKAIVEHSEMVGTKILQINGPGNMGLSPTGLPMGMVSALSFRYQNRVFRSFYALPGDICDISDPDAKYYTILRLAIAMPCGFLCTVTPANLLRLARTGDHERERLIRDLFDGTLRSDIAVPAALRNRLMPFISRRRPARARELEQIVERTGMLYPKDYWPLGLISCWLGGTVGFQSRDLPTFYGDVCQRDIGLVSTEGHHTIPFHDGRPEGVLSIRGNYYEFVPAEEMTSASPTVLECHELEPGRDYYLVLTTSSGLYRYDLGDVVRCQGYVGQAPVLEFLNKGKSCSDMEGEKISEHQVVHAVTTASQELGLRLDYFTAVPVRPDNTSVSSSHDAPYYALLVEQSAIADSAAGPFLEIVDRELVRQNVMYAGKRLDRYIGAPRLVQLPPGTWTEYARRQADSRGTGDSQYKHPALISDPHFLDQFISPASGVAGTDL